MKDIAPRTFKGPLRSVKKGLLILYTGNGKGKSSAAFGAVLRSLGRGYKVAVVQFMKGPWRSGEIAALKRFGPLFSYYSVGEGFTWETKSLKTDRTLAKKGWYICRRLLRARRHHLYVFDELIYVLKYKFLPLMEVLQSLKKRDPHAHVILTGRDAPSKLISLADLVSEMKEIKHPYKKGILAQPGLDY
jgi:cob(I)alamin adenosyltransferase